MAVEHEYVLEYTIDDDGIWLRCTKCPVFGAQNLGFTPSPDDVQEAVREHEALTSST